eukprot:PhF_6_TR41810/c0_g1_i1/m.63422/K03262/EIF5; translation initiation factor 5
MEISKGIAVDPRDIDDPFCRYKMDPLRVQIERGSTVFPNLREVSAKLYRDPEILIKYFSVVLSVPYKEHDNNRNGSGSTYYLPGKHVNSTLNFQTLLYDFIEKAVLCPACRNPQTTYCVLGSGGRSGGKAKKGGGNNSIGLDCCSCGHVGDITSTLSEKMITFVGRKVVEEEEKRVRAFKELVSGLDLVECNGRGRIREEEESSWRSLLAR